MKDKEMAWLSRSTGFQDRGGPGILVHSRHLAVCSDFGGFKIIGAAIEWPSACFLA